MNVVLTVSGSGSATAVLSAIQPAFEADTPGYRLNVLSGSSTGGGVKGVIEGVLDVAAMARPPKAEETAQEIAYVEIGRAGQAVIIHPDISLTNLTSAQIIAIFTGEATNWKQVGGPDQPIILYVRDEADSSTQTLRQAILGDRPFSETVAQVLTSQSDMQVAVAGTPGSIGIATWPAALAGGADVLAVAVDGIKPDDPAYPMTTRLGVGYLAGRQTEIQPLLDWLLSESGRAALQEFDLMTSR
ncbi:MAG: substrate-binding domain-containing protein [Anaerolineaceae bacterium]|nr:substrate-binding domain-containing protein [Anaerolineaceae bacterium]